VRVRGQKNVVESYFTCSEKECTTVSRKKNCVSKSGNNARGLYIGLVSLNRRFG
jgi:hypothetical protein